MLERVCSSNCSSRRTGGTTKAKQRLHPWGARPRTYINVAVDEGNVWFVALAFALNSRIDREQGRIEVETKRGRSSKRMATENRASTSKPAGHWRLRQQQPIEVVSLMPYSVVRMSRE